MDTNQKKISTLQANKQTHGIRFVGIDGIPHSVVEKLFVFAAQGDEMRALNLNFTFPNSTL